MEYYASFLNDYANATPEDNEERGPLRACADSAAASNEQIAHHDLNSLDKILSIEKRLKGHFETLVAPGRRFVREGRLRLLQIGDKMLEAPIDCLMIVLSDLLVIAKVAKHDKFEILDRIPMKDAVVSMVCSKSIMTYNIYVYITLICEYIQDPKENSAAGFDDCFKIFRSSSSDGDGKSGYLFAAITIRDKRLLVDSITQIKMKVMK